MSAHIRFLRLLLNIILLFTFILSAINYKLCVYLFQQGIGQTKVITGAQAVDEIKENLNSVELSNLNLIPQIKQFTIDSLGYKHTSNFNKIYNQHNKPLLWVITASNKYSLTAFEWDFPLLGRVSYKGFFKEELALKEKYSLKASDYDVGIRTVSAWSTLGWFNDPLLSSQLSKSKGGFCNLLFHELFHATFYAPNNVNNNENLADFIAHKATLQFLKSDSLALLAYTQKQDENKKINEFLYTTTTNYKVFLDSIQLNPKKHILKQIWLLKMVKNLKMIPISNIKRLQSISQEILTEQNAFFID